MNILMVSTEAYPYSKPSGLANVVYGLARAMRIEAEEDVRVIMPLYRGKLDVNLMTPIASNLEVPMGYYSRTVNLWKAETPFPCYLLQHDFYFERDALYGFLDDYERFIFFSRAALEVLKAPEFVEHENKWFPQIVHGFNSLTGLMPYWLQQKPFTDSRFILTLHNMDVPGVYGSRALLVSEQASAGIYPDLGESRQHISFLGRGLRFADRIGMANPAYEPGLNPLPSSLKTLEVVIASRLQNHELLPIRNGIDVQVYDPGNDSALEQHFNYRSLEERVKNKLALQREAGLCVNAERPLLGIVGRMHTARGYGQLVSLKEKLLNSGQVQLVILGEPENWRYLELLEGWKREWASSGWGQEGLPWIKIYSDFNEKIARQIYAASDLFLIPALELPSGTQQYIAMHYGAVPVVHRTGALYNSVEPYVEGLDLRALRGKGVGVGFAYEGNGTHFLEAVSSALDLYRKDPKTWRDIQRHNMYEDFSWTEPAEKYLDLYADALRTAHQPIPPGELLPQDAKVEGNERLLQAIREIDRLPGMHGRDIRYMLKHAARLIRWVFESRSDAADVYVWVAQEYLQPEQEAGNEIMLSPASENPYASASEQESMQVVSSLWRDTAGRHLINHSDLEFQAEGLLHSLANEGWSSASDWLPGDEPPLNDSCQVLPDLQNQPIAQAKGWRTGWSAVIASHSRVMGRIDLLFPVIFSDKDTAWIVEALSTLSNSFGLRLETVRFAMEKDQVQDLTARLMNAGSLNEALDGLQQEIYQLPQVRHAWVYFLEQDALQATSDVAKELDILGRPYAQEVQHRGEEIYVSDWLSDARRQAIGYTENNTPLRALIAVPLHKKNEAASNLIGVLMVASEKPAAFSRDQQRWLCKLLAPQAAAVLDTFRCIEQKNRQREEHISQTEANRVQQLHNLADSLVMGGDFDQLLHSIVSTTATELGVKTASIYIYDKVRDRLTLEAATGYHAPLEKLAEKPNYALGEGVTGSIGLQDDILRANSLTELKKKVPAYKGKYLDEGGQHEPNAFLGIPLVIKPRDGSQRQLIGVMKVEDLEDGVNPKFSLQDESLAQMMGNVIATVVHNIQVSRGQLGILGDNLETLSKVLVGASDLNTLLQQTVVTIADLVGAKASSLYLVEESTNQLVIQAASGYQEILLKQSIRPSYARGQGVTGWIWHEGKAVKADNYEELHAHPAWKGKQDDLQMQKPTSFLGLPLTVTDRYTREPRVIGVLKVEDVKITASHPEDYFTNQDVLLVKMMANVIATVVYNTQFSRGQLNTLQDNLDRLSKVLAGASDLEMLLQQTVETIANLVGAKASSLYLVEESNNQLVIQAASGYQEVLLKQPIRPSYTRGQGVTGWIWQEGKEFKADNYQELHVHPAWKGKQDDLQLHRPTSFFGLPLTVTDRYTRQPWVIGVLKVEDVNITSSHPEGYFTNQDVLLVKMMANVIATVVYNAQISKGQLGELQANLSTLTNALAAGNNMETLVTQVVDTTASVLNAKAASLYLVDKATEELVIQAASGYQEVLLKQPIRPTYARGQGVTGWIWQERKEFKADNYEELHAHPAWKGKQDDLQQQTPSSFLGLPLIVRTPKEEVIGVLKVEDVQSTAKHPEAYFTAQDVLLVTMMGNVIASVIETTRNGEKRVGELLKNMDPQLLFDPTARSLLQSFWISREEGMIDQLAIALAAQLDSHPELLVERVKALFEADANSLLYYRVAVHAKTREVREQFRLVYQVFSQSSPYSSWASVSSILQTWLDLWKTVPSLDDFCTSVRNLIEPAVRRSGLQFKSLKTDPNSNWVGVITDADPAQQPLIHQLSPSVLITFLRDGELNLSAWHQLVDFAKQTGPFQITICIDWRHQCQNTVQAELRGDPNLRKSDIVIINVHDLIQVQREAGAPALLRVQITRQLTHSSLFILEGPVPEEMFFGRKEEVSRLLAHLRTSDFALVGNRQIGKTSLMRIVMRRLGETSWAAPLWIDAQAIKSAHEFLDSFQELTTVPVAECTLKGLGTALEQFKASVQRQPILFIDEIDELVHADVVGGADLIRKFRSLAQRHVCHFVFGGSKLLARQLEDADLRLYNFAEPLVIGLLLAEDAQAAFMEPLKAMDIRLENPAKIVQKVLDLTSCHPNLIQQAGDILSKQALARGNRVITELDVETLAQDSLFASRCLNKLWGAASAFEQLVTLLAPDNGFTEAEMAACLAENGLSIEMRKLENALKALLVYSLLRKHHRQYFLMTSNFKQQLQLFEDVDNLIAKRLEDLKLKDLDA